MMFTKPARSLPGAFALVIASFLAGCQGSTDAPSSQAPTQNLPSPVVDAKGFRLVGQFADPFDTLQFNVVRSVFLQAEGSRAVFLMASQDIRLNRYRWILHPLDGTTLLPLQTKDEADPNQYQFRYDFASNTLFGFARTSATRIDYFSGATPTPQFMQPPYAGAPLDLDTRYSVFKDRTDPARIYVFDHKMLAYASPGPSSSTNLTPEASIVSAAALSADQNADSATNFIKTAHLAYVTHSMDSGTELKIARNRGIIAKKRIFRDTTFYPEHRVVAMHVSRSGDRLDIGVGWMNTSGFGLRLALYRFQIASNSIETVYDSVVAPSDTIDAFFEGTFHFGLKRVAPAGTLQELAAPVVRNGTTWKVFHTARAVFLSVQKEYGFLELYRQDLP